MVMISAPIVANFRDRFQMSPALSLKHALVFGREGGCATNALSWHVYTLLSHLIVLLAVRSLLYEFVQVLRVQPVHHFLLCDLQYLHSCLAYSWVLDGLGFFQVDDLLANPRLLIPDAKLVRLVLNQIERPWSKLLLLGYAEVSTCLNRISEQCLPCLAFSLARTWSIIFHNIHLFCQAALTLHDKKRLCVLLPFMQYGDSRCNLF